MQIEPLSLTNRTAALAYLREAPYRNALPLSNASQLRAACDVLVAEIDERVVGVASTYHDLPIANVTFAANSDVIVRALLDELAVRNPPLRNGTVWTLLPNDRYAQLLLHATLVQSEVEWQMVAELETLRVPKQHAPRRLHEADLSQMQALALAAGLSVWHESALQLGPAFGCFRGDELVAMAATHFATPEVVEIGHVATHPDARRQGYGSACTAALAQAAFALAPRVFLMVLEHNKSALATYKSIGFHALEPFHLTEFRWAN